MSAEQNPLDPELERALSEIRGEQVDPAVVEAAGERVWAKLAAEVHPHEHLRTCADFQALIPDYRAGRLAEARALLVRDHLHACVACRRVFEGRAPESKLVEMPAARLAGRFQTRRWAIAAALVAGVGLSAWFGLTRLGVFGGLTTVQAVNGTLYRVTPAGMQPMKPGDAIAEGVEVRTAKDSGAMLRLGDGSVVEMRERSSFATARAASDLTVRLGQGSVIVEAAHRRFGHLYVSTADCRVAVTGTVFGVSAGVKGSRVSVIQGEVRVDQQSGGKVLGPGQQLTTSPTLSALRVADDIAWSRNYDQHLALLKELKALETGLNEVRMPDLRYSSAILDRLPAGTVFYASIPNLTGYFADAQSVFRQRMAESPQLRTWLEGRTGNFDQVIDRLRSAGEYFGDEIVIAGVAGDKLAHGPVFVAQEKRPGFNAFLEHEGAHVRAESKGGLVAFSPTAGAAASLLDSLDGGFRQSALYARVNEAYRNGAGIIFAADLAKLHPDPNGPQYLVAEQKQTPARTDIRAVVGFAGPRTGIAGWLAAPAPMGALNYLSPDATFVASFVVKSPASIVDEVLSIGDSSTERARQQLAQAGATLGLDLRNDFAASLGGEFAVGMDGPVFPVPSWKLVVETYDPQRLQFSIGKFVEAYNREATGHGKPALRITEEAVNGRTYHGLGTSDENPLTQAAWTYSNGYLIAAPSRALVDRALQVRANGVGIAKSAAFLAMLPRDRYADSSALIYQNLGTTLGPVAGLLGSFAGGSPEAQQQIAGLGNLKASLITVYGEGDRIEIAGSGEQFKLPVGALLSGGLSAVARQAMPLGQMARHSMPGGER